MLNNEWRGLVSNYTEDEALIKRLYDKIQQHYSEKNRFYHNLEHIASMLNAVNKFQNNILDYDVVRFAIWYHDIIYLPLKTDNEEKSAAFARETLLQLGFENSRLNKVERMILKTKNHMLHDTSEDFDIKLFLDTDLLILGSARDVYKNYMEQIRKEYYLIPGFIYNKKRKQVLQKFLDSEFIYRTFEYRNLLENKARENLKFEIETL